MSREGCEFYDDPDTYETYAARRDDANSPNEVLDRPVIEALVGDVSGLEILDLGCGQAQFGSWALAKGCASYTGLAGSKRMISAANSALEGTSGTAHLGDILDWDYPQSKFDLVVSRLVFHYIEDLQRPLAAVRNTLRVSGRLVFSVEHPVITSSDESSRSGGKRSNWIVDRYFETGLRETEWMGSEVKKFHRTVEDYFQLVRQAGFIVEALRESRPIPELFPETTEFERRNRVPLMLFMECRPLP